jgi:hypothetical protein
MVLEASGSRRRVGIWVGERNLHDDRGHRHFVLVVALFWFVVVAGL